MNLQTKVKIVGILAGTLLGVSLLMLFMVFLPRVFTARAELGKAECKFQDLYIGERVNINGTPYVITTNEDLHYVGTYWIKLDRIGKNSTE